MSENHVENYRSAQVRVKLNAALELLERFDDPAPSAIDLTQNAVLIDQALELLEKSSEE